MERSHHGSVVIQTVSLRTPSRPGHFEKKRPTNSSFLPNSFRSGGQSPACEIVMRIWIALIVLCATAVGEAVRADEVPSSFNTKERVALTTSRVIGSPEPPLPYQVRQAYTALETKRPLAISHEVGTRHLLLIEHLSKGGQIVRVRGDEENPQRDVLLKLDDVIYGIALHPDFEQNGYLFVGSNGPQVNDEAESEGDEKVEKPEKKTRVTRFTVDRQAPFACDPKSGKVIIEWLSDGHNGGDLAFGADGMLYISSGDGTSDSDTNLAGQNLTHLLAKVLRIDVEQPAEDQAYRVPKDNPFVGQEGIRPETWAYGFRNPWRLHIDPKSGDLWIGNNGQDLWEQVYLVKRGANYGWSVMEGGHPFYLDREQGPTPFSKPIADHPHAEARSLTGGVVYHGQKLPKLQGAYIYGDYSTGKIWGIRHKRGKVTWQQELADTNLQITGFGTDAAGELLVVDYGGALYRLEPRPEETSSPPPFPRLLSETGLFASVPEHRPQPALIPYSVNAPLWSDGSQKERFIALPNLETIKLRETFGWNFPDGAVLVKTFSIPTAQGEPAMRRIETRLFTRQQGEWQGYSYRWNDEQTDAALVDKAGLDHTFVIPETVADQGTKLLKWHFPSRAECMVCHSRAANYVLGPSTLQMNRDHQYGDETINQIELLEQLGVFDKPSKVAVEELPRLVDPYDPKADLNLRARSYLHANCANCHIRAGGGNAQFDINFAIEPEKMKLINFPALHKLPDLDRGLLVKPQDPLHSALLLRVSRRGRGQMPPLASNQLDQQAIELLKAWIEQMPAEAK